MEEKYKVDIVSLDNFEIEYATFGQGKNNLVILPGMSLYYVHEYAGGAYQRYLSFENEYTVYIFDRPNNLNENSTLESIADDTICAINKLGLKDINIIGCSQGGMIAQYIAIKNPNLVRKLVLASTLAETNSTYEFTMKLWEALAKNGDVVALNQDINSRVYSKEYYEKYKDIFKANESIGTKEQLDRFGLLSRVGLTINTVDKLEEISCPILAIGSKLDKITTIDGMASIIENSICQFCIYEEYSHAVYDEADDFIDTVRSFIE